MENKDQRKWQIRGAVLVIFWLGFLAGALTLNIYRSSRPPSFNEARRERFEQMMNRLKLTSEQRTQVNQILNETRQKFIDFRKQSQPGFKEIRQQNDARLQEILTPDQWKQWQQMANDMRQRRN